MTYDVAIIGAGIVGLATARNLSDRFPELAIVVLEKEHDIATHQTGRNSGVIHSGIYYKPGSLKARNCREGRKAMIEFCEKEGIAYKMCGKVIVAVSEDERPLLHDIYRRGQENGIRCELIGRERLLELEPHAAGVEAIYVPDAGIIDYVGVARRLCDIVVGRGHRLLTGAEVQRIGHEDGEVILETPQGAVRARHVVSCAGLYADHVARLSGQEPGMMIVPFRGEYFDLKPEARYLCRTLIYPVPDPAFPFLGVHFTSTIDGGVECGPNAVLAFAREGYEFSTINGTELMETLSYRGFRRLALKHWKKEAFEMWRSLSKRAFVKTLQRLIPEIKPDDIVKAPAGVRAQAVLPNGDLADDFVIKAGGRILNVCNAPSPAATASLKVGEEIVDRLAKQLR